MLFNSYSYEILYEQVHWIYLQRDLKLLLVTVNNRLKFEIEIVLDLSCHPVETSLCRMMQNLFRYPEPFMHRSRVWETDRQTETALEIAWSNNLQELGHCDLVCWVYRSGAASWASLLLFIQYNIVWVDMFRSVSVCHGLSVYLGVFIYCGA